MQISTTKMAMSSIPATGTRIMSCTPNLKEVPVTVAVHSLEVDESTFRLQLDLTVDWLGL